MSVASERGSSRRASTRGRSSASTRGRSDASAKKASNSSRNSGASASRSRATSRKQSSNGRTERSSSGGTQSASGSAKNTSSAKNTGSGAREGVTNIVVPALTATLGIAGGVLLGRSRLAHNQKVLGVSVPTKIDLGGITQQIGEAGRQFGKLAGEVRSVREKAEQIARAIT